MQTEIFRRAKNSENIQNLLLFYLRTIYVQFCIAIFYQLSINLIHNQSCYLGHLEDVPEYLKKSDEYVGTRASLIPGLNFCKVGLQPLGLATFFDF